MKQQKQHSTAYSEEAFLAFSLIYLNQVICPAVKSPRSSEFEDFYNCEEYIDQESFDEEVVPSLNFLMDERGLRLLEFQSDIETADAKHQEKQQLARQFLEVTGELLANADRELTNLEDADNNLFGSAIVRGSREIADAVSQLAETLESQQHRRALAQSSLQDFSQGLLLDSSTSSPSSNTGTSLSLVSTNSSNNGQVVTQQEVEAAMQVFAELLRDIETALRGIEQEEADEIAEVALSVAHVFVVGLQHVHSQITPDELVAAASADHPYYVEDSNRIQLIVDDDGVPEVDGNIHVPHHVRPTSSRSIQPPRLRCLWPPVGPAVSDFLHWSKSEVLDKQHWSVAAGLGIVLWPYAVGAAVLGTPALVVDHVLQQTYDHFSDSPVINAAEVAAGQAGQTARLSYLTARTVVRPTLRVAQRQIQRHGPGAVHWAQDQIQHPVRTVHNAAHGLLWCSQQALGWVKDRVMGDDDAATRDAVLRNSI